MISNTLYSKLTAHTRVACLLTILFLGSIKLSAQTSASETNDTGRLSEFVVTGQYTPAPLEKAVQNIKVIYDKKITSMAAQNLRDVLSNQLNMRLSQDNLLGAGLSMQGVSGQNVKILMDGVPVVGRQDGNIDISQINLQQVERIEIIEGPMSVNYGSDALAGTINIITKKPERNVVDGRISTYYESVGRYNLNGSLGFQKDRHSISISVGRNFFDGWNPGEQPTLNFEAHVADSSRALLWKPKLQYLAGLQYGYKVKGITYGLRSNYFQEEITNRGIPGYRMQSASDDYYNTRRIDNVVTASGRLNSKSSIYAHLAFNNYERKKMSYINDLTNLEQKLNESPGAQDTTIFNTWNSRAAYTRQVVKGKLEYEVGYEVNKTTMLSNRLQAGEQHMGDYALFASAEYSPWEKLTVRPGLRVAHNTKYSAPVVPSLNIRYKASESITARFSYARGFRAPDLKELYFYFVDANHNILGNPNLQAEQGNNFNASINYAMRGDKVKKNFGLSTFYNNIAHKINLAQQAGGGITDYTYININRFRSMGAFLNGEIAYANITVGSGLGVTGIHSDLNTGVKQGEFLFSPEVQLNSSYEFRALGMVASIFGKYNGVSQSFVTDSVGNAGILKLQDYTIVDFTLSKKFKENKVVLSAGIKNLLNVQNLNSNTNGNVAPPQPGPHISGNGNQSIATGRTFFIKLDLALRRSTR